MRLQSLELSEGQSPFLYATVHTLRDGHCSERRQCDRVSPVSVDFGAHTLRTPVRSLVRV